jgi:hypothetical protein
MTKLIHSPLVFAPLIVGDCAAGWRARLDTPRHNMQSFLGGDGPLPNRFKCPQRALERDDYDDE